MSVEHIRLQIAFDGGQILGALVAAAAADALQQALASGTDGVHELEADDGTYLIALRRVAYVKRDARETRIGFSGDE